jgi:hypothetical protein
MDQEVINPPIKLNHIHKRLMVIYNLSDMRSVWKKVRSEWKKETKIELPKRFRKYPEIWEELNIWVEDKIAKYVEEGGEDINYLNKADLKPRGWDDKIIAQIYPAPDKVIYLGRGRHAYYYNGARVSELEDSEEFINYISEKLEKQERRKSAKSRRENRGSRFGSEYM